MLTSRIRYSGQVSDGRVPGSETDNPCGGGGGGGIRLEKKDTWQV